MKYILASASPRRSKILSDIGLVFETVPAEIDESMPRHVKPHMAVQELALKKAAAAACGAERDSVIIAADTVVCVQGKILGKPCDEKEAADMLRMLSGRAHEVLTGVAVIRARDGFSATFFESTEVYFKELTDGQIIEYVKTGEPADKAGAYGIQGFGSLFVSGIRGDFQNVVGLPVSRLYDFLRDEFNIDLLVSDNKGERAK